MQHTQGMVVHSNAGHDKNRFYILVRLEAGFGYIADGKRRKLCAPKRKNLAHLNITQTVVELSSIDTDKKLRRVLHGFNNDAIPVAE